MSPRFTKLGALAKTENLLKLFADRVSRTVKSTTDLLRENYWRPQLLQLSFENDWRRIPRFSFNASNDHFIVSERQSPQPRYNFVDHRPRCVRYYSERITERWFTNSSPRPRNYRIFLWDRFRFIVRQNVLITLCVILLNSSGGQVLWIYAYIISVSLVISGLKDRIA